MREERRLESESRERENRGDRLCDPRLRGESVWRDIENEIGRKNIPAYDRAVALISYLRAIAEEDGGVDTFSSHLDSLRFRHRRKFRLIERLDRLDKA